MGRAEDMWQEGLKQRLSDFQSVLDVRVSGNRDVGLAAREILATECANEVFSLVFQKFFQDDSRKGHIPTDVDQSEKWTSLPTSDSVQRVVPRLLDAVERQDQANAIKALEDMGILRLCSTPQRVLDRLELRVASVMGMGQVIPLVEMALLAVKLREFERASDYAERAKALSPGAPELHDLHTAFGIVALNSGEVAAAKDHLSDSIRVCERNEASCLACALRPFNLSLAQQLLEHGESDAVEKYLVRCQRVWEPATKRIAAWIEAIRVGEKPTFVLPPPSRRLLAISIRNTVSMVEAELASEKSITDTQAGLKEMRADAKRQTQAAIRGGLRTERN